jgi:hypothetical protein
MSFFKSTLAGLVMVCGLSVASVTRAEFVNVDLPVANGEFSLPEIPVDSWLKCVPDSWARVGGNTSYSGVQNVGGDGLAILGLAKNSSSCWFSQNNIGADFVAGDTYTLGFDYANAQTGAYTMTAKIVYNNGVDLLTEGAFSVAASQGWTHGTVSGVATGASTGPIGIMFQFSTPNVTANYSALLDSVTLTRTYSAVPEPSAIVLAAMGLVGLLGYAWRRRK